MFYLTSAGTISTMTVNKMENQVSAETQVLKFESRNLDTNFLRLNMKNLKRKSMEIHSPTL